VSRRRSPRSASGILRQGTTPTPGHLPPPGRPGARHPNRRPATPVNVPAPGMGAVASAGRAALIPAFSRSTAQLATWLVWDGLRVKGVQRLRGHERASTTLNRYVHAPRDYDARVRDLFKDDEDDEPDDPEDGVLAPVC